MADGTDDIVAPITFGQLSLWRSWVEIPLEARPAWHIARLWTVPPDTPIESVQFALDTLQKRHESLRTVYTIDQPLPEQVVKPAAPVALPVVAGTRWSYQEGVDAAKELAGTNFDLATDYGWRVKLLAAGPGEVSYLCVAIHHMTMDDWATNVLRAEFEALLGGDVSGLAPRPLVEPMQPRHLAELQRSPSWVARRGAAEKYWRTLLAHYPVATGTNAGMSFSRRSKRQRAQISSLSLGPAVRRIAKKYAVSPPSVGLALVITGYGEFGIELTEPLILMTANRFDPRVQGMISTMNQATLLDVPPLTTDFGKYAQAVEWASRIAYRHGCYSIDHFTEVVAEVRGAPLKYDFFFNYKAGESVTHGDDWPPVEELVTDIGAAPQQTGPRLETRVTGVRQLTVDIRADSDFLAADTLRKLVDWIGRRLYQLAD